jgi:magnesium-protoporphyrin O-methyltransferase
VTCPHCVDADTFFGPRLARRDLDRYRRRGPSPTTRMLLDAIRTRGRVEGTTVLDVGGGVGAIQHELLDAGAIHATSVDASGAYLAAAREEAERRGHAERLDQRLGDFVELADQVDPADVVTLDRVLCCYPDMPSLVEASAGRAGTLYGLVLPREGWWVRAGAALVNAVQALLGRDFRVFVHPTPAVRAAVESCGLRPVFSDRTFLWRVMLFERREAGAHPPG